MNIEQIDAHCDLYEKQLKSGGQVTVEAFLKENCIGSTRSTEIPILLPWKAVHGRMNPPLPRPHLELEPVRDRLLAITDCCSKSAKEAWASCTWPNSLGPLRGESPSKW